MSEDNFIIKLRARLNAAKVETKEILDNLEELIAICCVSLSRSPERFNAILPNWRLESEIWLLGIITDTLIQYDILVKLDETPSTFQSREYHCILLAIINGVKIQGATNSEMMIEFSEYHVRITNLYYQIKQSDNNLLVRVRSNMLRRGAEVLALARVERAKTLNDGISIIVGGE